MRHAIALLLALFTACGAIPVRAQTWSPLPSSGFERLYHRAIYDSLRSRMLVFGGVDSLFRNDVHELTLTGSPTWSLLSPSGTPPDVRDTHTLVYDPVRDRMLLFGGAKMFGLTVVIFNDVWAMSLGPSPTWTQLSPTGTKPAARHGHTMIYDPVRDRLIIFGGRDVTGVRNDVWELSLAGGTPAWTLLAPSGTPPTARGDATAIYDPVRDRMILFGGFGNNWDSDVWELTFSPLAWNPITPAVAGPSARDRHTAIYDPVNDRMVVFGGRDGPGHWTNDLWSLSLAGSAAWLPIMPGGGSTPPARWGHSAIYDAAGQRLVTFGGSAATGFYFDDAWALSLGPAVAVGELPPGSRLSAISAGPNPARASWSIQFRTSQAANVSLRLFDGAGRTVRDLSSGWLSSGAHSLPWDLRSSAGRRVPPGVYFYDLRDDVGDRLRRALVVIAE